MQDLYVKKRQNSFMFPASCVDQKLDFVDGIKTFSQRFHNARKGFFKNKDHPIISNGKFQIDVICKICS